MAATTLGDAMEDTIQRTQKTLPASDVIGEAEPVAVRVDLDEYGAQYLQQKRIESALARWKHFCPPDLIETNWQDARLAPFAASWRTILAWKGGRKGLLATGVSGRGKSRSMWALMRQLAEEGRESRYFTAASWFSQLQGFVNYGRDEALGWVSATAAVPIVFVDDLGQEALQASKQDWAQGWFFQFCDMRLGRGLPLFITTNQTAKELAGDAGSLRGDPLVRRLLELCDVVKF